MARRQKKQAERERKKANTQEDAELEAKLRRIVEPPKPIFGPAGVLSANQDNPPKVVKDETD